MRPSARLTHLSLLVAGAYALHSLRYLIAYGEAAEREALAQVMPIWRWPRKP